MRILVVDDDPELSELVGRSLTRDGHAVVEARGVREARAALGEEVDVMVLDVGLPDGSGVELCRELRARGDAIPILLLTAQSAVGQRVEGLDAGADDYLVKPFAVAELRARVRAIARRRSAPPVAFMQVGDVELDLAGRRVRRAGYEVELTAREWAIIETLAASRGRVVARDRLLEAGWEEATEAAAASLEVLIGRIRRKLGRSVVRTARGLGYAID
ncbi:MAG: response regulator transcription factor [Sandaracinaceae bacterium]